MALHITQIGKHKFICGLFWQALSRPRELEKEAKDLARKIDSDLMVLRVDHTTAQAGFTNSREGARPGMNSLGAVVSKTLAMEGAYYDGDRQQLHNWLGAFKLADGKWVYFAVREASFLPNGDFAGTKEEVLDRLHGDYGLGGWNAVIGDEELAEHGFHNFNARSIETLIPRKSDGTVKPQKWWRLRKVDNSNNLRIAVAAAVVLVVAGGGFTYWKQQKLKQEEIEREKAFEATRRQMQQGKAADVGPGPWNGKPLPRELARACVERLKYLAPGGWLLDSFECTPSGVSYTWNRNGSLVSFLLEQVPAAQVEEGGERARMTEAFTLAASKDEALLELRQLLPPLLSAMQLQRITFRFAPMPPPPPPPDGQPAPPPPWKGYTLSITPNGFGPVEIAAVLSRPGIRMEKLVYRSGQWMIEGTMYGK